MTTLSELESIDLESITKALESIPVRLRRKIITRFPKNPYPRFVYKYRNLDPHSTDSIERLKQIVLNSKLWLSSPEDFNDPFDMGMHITVDGTTKEKLQRFQTLVKNHSQLSWKKRQAEVVKFMHRSNKDLRAVAQRSHDKNIALFGVCSFAGTPRSILMWSHYTRDHQGICLQFDIAHDPRVFLQAIPVSYENSYPTFNWLNETMDSRSLTAKFSDWSYEKERRIIKIDGANQHLSFSPQCVTRIILGCKVKQETVTCIKKLLEMRKEKNLPPIALYQAMMHAREYKIVVRKFNG